MIRLLILLLKLCKLEEIINQLMYKQYRIIYDGEKKNLAKNENLQKSRVLVKLLDKYNIYIFLVTNHKSLS